MLSTPSQPRALPYPSTTPPPTTRRYNSVPATDDPGVSLALCVFEQKVDRKRVLENSSVFFYVQLAYSTMATSPAVILSKSKSMTHFFSSNRISICYDVTVYALTAIEAITSPGSFLSDWVSESVSQ